MADIIDLKFVTDTTGLDKAVTKSRSLEKRIVKLAKEVATGRITSDQYTKAVKKSATELQKLSGLGIRARKSVFDYSVSVYQAATASNKAAASTDNYSSSLNQLSTSSIGATSSLGMLSRQAHQTKNKMNANGMAMQQLGYQTGDFIVQVQSGTNAWVAAGQQLTQLTGVLGMMNPAWIGIGAALGIVVPLVTAVGAAFSRSKSSADDLTNSVDDLKEAYSSLNGIQDTLSETLHGPWAAAAEGIDNYLRKVEKVKLKQIEVTGEGTLTRQSTTLERIMRDFGGKEATAGVVSQIEESMKRLLNQAVQLSSTGGQGLGGEAQSALAQLGVETKSAVDVVAKVTKLNEDIQSLGKAKSQFLGLFDELKSTEDLVIRVTDLREEYNKVGADGVVGMIDKLIDEWELQKDIDAYRKKLVEQQKTESQRQADREAQWQRDLAAQGKKTAAERAAYEKEIRDLDAKGDAAILERQAQAEIDLFNENMAYEKEQKRLDAAGDLAILNAQANAELELFQDNAKYAAEQAALRLKEQRELNNEVEKLAERLAIPFERALGLIRQAKAEATVGLDAFGGPGSFKHGGIQTYKPESLKVGKGAKPTTMEGPIKALERQIELSKALFGLEGQSRREQEIFMQLQFQNRDADKKAKEEDLRDLAEKVAKQEELTKVFEEQGQAQKDLADSIANSMGDALTSIVDGTKSVSDAFKDMARAIIAELYQIYVVKQITGMISAAINPYMPTFTPSENGNVFSNGNLVPYADGGVVGGPTYFPMKDGRTGLMGEAGPEAIMPLKRGKNGKLGVQAEGGSGDVIIHQNFNFTANGDESVKKIIAQQAPAIANMTKKQIMDDRRRGGQMKQAFG